MALSLLSAALAGLALCSTALASPQSLQSLQPRNAGSQVVTPCTTGYTPFKYVGCYFDQRDPSTLDFDTFIPSSAMTIETCTAACKGNGYKYAGLEFYGACFCGNALNGLPAPESDCVDPCTSNQSQICGGTDRLSIYEDPTFPPSDPNIITDYASLGCYTEADNNNRALIIAPPVDGATLTTAKCLTACKARGYPYAGTEYSSECYCGTSLNPGAVPAPSSECSNTCNGDPTQSCGGPRRLNLYYAKDLVSTQPCGYQPPPPPPTPGCTDTAYGYIAGKSKTFIELGIGKNWGWVLSGTPPLTGDLWAGAGQNDLSKGTKVGSFKIEVVSGKLVVTYTLTKTGCSLLETHVYVGKTYPSKIAPGQFGNTHEALPAGTTTDSFSINYDSTKATYIVHAGVVCPCA